MKGSTATAIKESLSKQEKHLVVKNRNGRVVLKGGFEKLEPGKVTESLMFRGEKGVIKFCCMTDWLDKEPVWEGNTLVIQLCLSQERGYNS